MQGGGTDDDRSPSGGLTTRLTSWNGTKWGGRRDCSSGCLRLAIGNLIDQRRLKQNEARGSVIVMLFRPGRRLEDREAVDRRAPPRPEVRWVLDDGGGVIEAIGPTPELEAMLPRGQGVFYARRVESGWDIISPVADLGEAECHHARTRTGTP
jgi:hypothetical protein